MLLMGIFSINIFIKLFPSLVLFEFQFFVTNTICLTSLFYNVPVQHKELMLKRDKYSEHSRMSSYGIIKKENYKYATFLSAFFFGLVIWVSMCGMVHRVCTDNQLTICSNKHLPSCSSFYDGYYWNIEKYDKAVFKISERIKQKFTY